MKNKCVVCLKRKGKRVCKIRNESLVCSRCCAEIRNQNCEGCFYFIQAGRHTLEKMNRSTDVPEFMAIIDPEIDKEVDDALTYAEDGNLAKAEKLVLALLDKRPDLFMVQYAMGTVQALKGNFSDSIRYFDNCLAIFPYFIEAWFNRGSAFMSLGKLGEAVQSLRKVCEYGAEENDFVADARNLLRKIEVGIEEDFGLSLENFLRAAEEHDTAFSHMENKDYEKAISGFQRALLVDKHHASTYGNLGLCYALTGQEEAALSAFDQALSIDPGYEPAIQNKEVLLSLKKEGKDISSIKKFVNHSKLSSKKRGNKR